MTDPTRWDALNESERALLRAALRYRDLTPAARHDHTCDVIDALSREAVALTSDDPPPAPIEMPEGWELDTDDGLLSSNDTALILGETGCGVQLQETEGDIPFAVMAIALRSAGWSVEAPHG